MTVTQSSKPRTSTIMDSPNLQCGNVLMVYCKGTTAENLYQQHRVKCLTDIYMRPGIVLLNSRASVGKLELLLNLSFHCYYSAIQLTFEIFLSFLTQTVWLTAKSTLPRVCNLHSSSVDGVFHEWRGSWLLTLSGWLQPNLFLPEGLCAGRCTHFITNTENVPNVPPQHLTWVVSSPTNSDILEDIKISGGFRGGFLGFHGTLL